MGWKGRTRSSTASARPPPRGVGEERGEEPEAPVRAVAEPGRLQRRQDYAGPHAEHAAIALPGHLRLHGHLHVVEGVVRIWLEERDPASRHEQPAHRPQRQAQVVNVVEREEADDGVEGAEQSRRRLDHVGDVERKLEAVACERAQALEQNGREIEPLDGVAALGEQQRVPAHAAADLEHALPGPEAGEAGERVDVPLEVRRAGRHHPGLVLLVVAQLRAVVLGARLRRQLGHRPPPPGRRGGVRPSSSRPRRPRASPAGAARAPSSSTRLPGAAPAPPARTASAPRCSRSWPRATAAGASASRGAGRRPVARGRRRSPRPRGTPARRESVRL